MQWNLSLISCNCQKRKLLLTLSARVSCVRIKLRNTYITLFGIHWFLLLKRPLLQLHDSLPSYCAGISSVSYCSLLMKPPNPFCSANANSPETAEFLQMPPPAQCCLGCMPPLLPPLSATTGCTDA